MTRMPVDPSHGQTRAVTTAFTFRTPVAMIEPSDRRPQLELRVIIRPQLRQILTHRRAARPHSAAGRCSVSHRARPGLSPGLIFHFIEAGATPLDSCCCELNS